MTSRHTPDCGTYQCAFGQLIKKKNKNTINISTITLEKINNKLAPAMLPVVHLASVLFYHRHHGHTHTHTQ